MQHNEYSLCLKVKQILLESYKAYTFHRLEFHYWFDITATWKRIKSPLKMWKTCSWGQHRGLWFWFDCIWHEELWRRNQISSSEERLSPGQGSLTWESSVCAAQSSAHLSFRLFFFLPLFFPFFSLFSDIFFARTSLIRSKNTCEQQNILYRSVRVNMASEVHMHDHAFWKYQDI